MSRITKFQRFKNELAFYVMWAINHSEVCISSIRASCANSCCPLGTKTFPLYNFPSGHTAANQFKISSLAAYEFIRGFSGGSSERKTYIKYYILGTLYRAKFCELDGKCNKHVHY